MIDGRYSEAQNGSAQIYVECQLVFPGGSWVAIAEVDAVADDGDSGWHKVRVYVDRLVVKIS